MKRKASEQLSLETPILSLDGRKPGKKIAIFVGVHGNEVCGPYAVNALLPELQIEEGTVTFVLANPRALEEGVRFTEQNLNRLFKRDEELTDLEKASYEYERSRELMSILDAHDVLLDVHSSATPGAIPFTVCEPFAYDIVKSFPTQIISSGWDSIQPGGTDYYMNRTGKVGICVESGFHNEPSSVDTAKEAIVAFLGSQGAFGTVLSETSPSVAPQTYIHVRHMHITKNNFTLNQPFDDFQYIEQGTIVGMDGDEVITADEDSYIIFARNREAQNQEAFLLARKAL